jgi:DNA-binding CsgD family transcriptional regulator
MKHARVWDLSQYPELTKRDKEWLKQILEEKRYEEIAADSGITVGTLKNRMHQIFNIVGIDDRISLLATYSGYEVKF